MNFVLGAIAFHIDVFSSQLSNKYFHITIWGPGSEVWRFSSEPAYSNSCLNHSSETLHTAKNSYHHLRVD